MKIIKLYPLFLTICVCVSSCITHPELVVFHKEEPLPENIPSEILPEIVELRIQPGDIVSIQVRSFQQPLAEPFNQNAQNMGGGNNQQNLAGYLVNTAGEISFPVLGYLNIKDLTMKELEALIIDKLAPYLKEPTVIARLLNFRVTVLGEVGSPGVYTLESNRSTLLEVLGSAGDLTPYSDRENILVIREFDGKREYGRVNIQNLDIFKSPYYYVKQNDIVYVEPQKKKIADVRQPFTNYLGWIATILGTGTLIFSLFTR